LPGTESAANVASSWPIMVTKDQLDQLEEHGYLNPGDRGNRADECEAIASHPSGLVAAKAETSAAALGFPGSVVLLIYNTLMGGRRA